MSAAKLNISFVNDEQRPSGSNLRELAKNVPWDECSRGIAWRAGKNELHLRTGVERMRGSAASGTQPRSGAVIRLITFAPLVSADTAYMP